VLVDKRTDIYSLGVLIYEIVIGIAPYGYISDASLIDALIAKAGNIEILKFGRMISTLEDLVKKLLLADLNKRISSFEEIRSHPFFEGFDLGMVERFKKGEVR